MKIIVKYVYFIFSLIFLLYLLLPNPNFPEASRDALQSNEPADTETPLRRAYFTNYSREEVVKHYLEQFSKNSFKNLPLITYRLNYPPEEAQSIIRDQTRSTFLEEIVHPFRESLYINGFEPKDEKDAIFIAGKFWRQKIIVRYVPSNLWLRFSIGVISLFLFSLILREWSKLMTKLKRRAKIWTFR